MAENTITLSVTRFDPAVNAKPHVQSYTIPFKDNIIVLNGLNWIKTHIDGSVNYRWSCRLGICGSCGMNVNGTPKLGCAAFLHDYLPGPILIEPLPNFPIVHNLVVNISSFLDKLSSIKPWIIREPAALFTNEHHQTITQINKYQQF